MDATDNVVLQIVRRGLRTQIFELLRDAPWRPRPEPGLRAEELAKQLDRAIERRDPTAASDAVHALHGEMRQMVRRSLEEARGERRLAGAV